MFFNSRLLYFSNFHSTGKIILDVEHNPNKLFVLNFTRNGLCITWGGGDGRCLGGGGVDLGDQYLDAVIYKI
jgi:hypothetical protein